MTVTEWEDSMLSVQEGTDSMPGQEIRFPMPRGMAKK